MRRCVALILTLTFLLSGCTSTKELRENLEVAADEYRNGIVLDIEQNILNSEHSDIFDNCDVKITVELHSQSIEQQIDICVFVDDIYDSYSFRQQHDIAYGLFSQLQSEINELEDKYELFSYWKHPDQIDTYCKAFDISSKYVYAIHNSRDWEFSFRTSANIYECSETMGHDYFRINGKEYYDSIFEKAYGSYTSYPCEVCSKEGVHEYKSFTGQLEHYCTTHYLEILDMLDALGAG